ncbi:WW domain-binding protein 4 [Xyrauchen texanus]|uniref:WW domain-binding protein 4 n=1 Tax=Xyrauchen texanus TaxID=154827 RepID=UPI0022427B9D|nr:WW domain-binding protein 4 [Xyrauchen texanus]
MADYWKSQPRKFCQYCKCWIADNKPSVEFHERGKNHKENVAAKITEIKKKSIAKLKQEEKMSKEFAAMEAAALIAYEQDLKRINAPSGESLSVTAAPVKPPNKPPNKPTTKTKTKPQHKAQRREFNVHKQMNSSSSNNNYNPGTVWVEGTTADGHVYYYNTITGASQWQKPDGFQSESTPPSSSSSSSSSSSAAAAGQSQESSVRSWMEAVSPEGYSYYYNTETGESSWKKPENFSPSDGSPHEDPGAAEEPESLSAGENSDAPKDTTEPETAEPETAEPEPAEPEPAESTNSSVPKISFRKRKEPTADEGGEEQADEGGRQEEEQKESDRRVTEAVEHVTLVRKPRQKNINPYGVWEQIQPEEDPYENVDLQLPQMESAVAAVAPPAVPQEPRTKFKERTITSLGDEGSAGATFKKRKTENGRTRSLRQRETDE